MPLCAQGWGGPQQSITRGTQKPPPSTTSVLWMQEDPLFILSVLGLLSNSLLCIHSKSLHFFTKTVMFFFLLLPILEQQKLQNYWF